MSWDNNKISLIGKVVMGSNENDESFYYEPAASGGYNLYVTVRREEVE
jgi:hypothetical protein